MLCLTLPQPEVFYPQNHYAELADILLDRLYHLHLWALIADFARKTGQR